MLPFYMKMFKAYHAQRNAIRHNMKEYGLSIGQPKVLRYLSTNQNCMLKDIAKGCDVEPATVSKILNDLEEMGMLKREIVKENKRAYRLRITKKGQVALDAWNIHCCEVEEVALAGFSEEERDQFTSYLARMYTNITTKTLD